MNTYIDSDFEPFLRVVHISDMHCKAASAVSDLKTEHRIRWMLTALRSIGLKNEADQIKSRWEEGLAGHDPRAHNRMCSFLSDYAAVPGYGDIPTWLLDTGDLSSLGDADSIQTALRWLERYKTILGAQQTLVLHGNHDAWPGKFPFAATTAEIDNHQYALRQLLGKSWPHMSIKAAIPHTNSYLRLNAVNSTLSDRWWNTLALGEVGMDPPWATFGNNQLAQLAQQTRKDFRADGVTRDFRILAVHHPVHYPPPRPLTQMRMLNDRSVADALIRFDKFGRGKLAHLVLSGHTHQTYPAMGALPIHSKGHKWFPLTEGQLQLIAGSLSQLPREQERAAFSAVDFIPQQFQILTFSASPKSTNQGQLLMERQVIGRPGGRGPYGFLEVPGTSTHVESILMEY